MIRLLGCRVDTNQNHMPRRRQVAAVTMLKKIRHSHGLSLGPAFLRHSIRFDVTVTRICKLVWNDGWNLALTMRTNCTLVGTTVQDFRTPWAPVRLEINRVPPESTGQGSKSVGCSDGFSHLLVDLFCDDKVMVVDMHSFVLLIHHPLERRECRRSWSVSSRGWLMLMMGVWWYYYTVPQDMHCPEECRLHDKVVLPASPLWSRAYLSNLYVPSMICIKKIAVSGC